MVSFRQEKKASKIRSVIERCWINDKEFFEQYSAFTSPQESINATVEMVLGIVQDRALDARFFTLQVNREVVGYICVELKHDLLYSFCIEPEWRCKKVVGVFMQKIEEVFASKAQFFCTLYENNRRAVNFFIRNGYQLVLTGKEGGTEKNIVCLKKAIRPDGNYSSSSDRPCVGSDHSGEQLRNGTQEQGCSNAQRTVSQ